MPLIKQHVIDRIQQDADIVAVAQQLGLDLKKAGANYKCLSPFAEEKTPSCVISPTKNIFKDFSSGYGGGPQKLLMLKERMSWIDSIKWLADFMHIQLEFEDETQEQEEKRITREQYLEVMELAQKAFSLELKRLPEDHPVKVYLQSRFTPDEIIEWQIGFAPNKFDFIKYTFWESGLLNACIECGLIKQAEGGKEYDFFRDRIIIPITDIRGRVISFGARTYPGAEKYQGKEPAKYINGLDTDLYDKSKELFGLDKALKAIREQAFVYLVEGYTDVTAWHRAEISNTVASCGTSLTSAQLKKLEKLGCKSIVSVRDNDPKYDKDTGKYLGNPGQEATIRDIELAIQNDFKIKVIRLPEGHDPASWIEEELKSNSITN